MIESPQRRVHTAAGSKTLHLLENNLQWMSQFYSGSKDSQIWIGNQCAYSWYLLQMTNIYSLKSSHLIQNIRNMNKRVIVEILSKCLHLYFYPGAVESARLLCRSHQCFSNVVNVNHPAGLMKMQVLGLSVESRYFSHGPGWCWLCWTVARCPEALRSPHCDWNMWGLQWDSQ